jgi:seryl-tRNA synthetase
MNDYFQSILKAAIENKWIIKLPKEPIYIYLHPMTKLITIIKDIIIEEIALKHKFKECIFPRLIPNSALIQTGWSDNHKNEIIEICPKIISSYEPKAGNIFMNENMACVNSLIYSLDPVQCVSLYYAYSDKVINDSDLPIQYFEHQGGWTFRNEINPDGIYRAIEFLRLEFVWIASEQTTTEIRNNLVEAVSMLMKTDMHLPIQAREGDLCFEKPDKDDPKDIYDINHIHDLFPFSSIDLICKYNEFNMEIVSACRYDKIPERFNIRSSNTKNKLWSGCLGVGLSRLALSFLINHGFDIEKWDETCKIKHIFKSKN